MTTKRTILHKIAWGFMVAVFFFAATPHTFVHNVLEDHRDTIDGIHKHPGVSDVHIHCEFLRVSLSPTLPGHPPVYHFVSHEFHIHFLAPLISLTKYYFFHYYLRGPPEMA